MKTSLHNLYIVSLLFSLNLSTLAQSISEYRFHRLNEKQKLTNGVINSIAQDSLGFSWVGTEDGLFRFDGRNFTSFRSSVNPGIPNNTINKVFVDSKNRVWILTNYGMARYDYESDSIASFLPDGIVETGRIKTFTDMVELKNNDLLFGTSDGGVLRRSGGVFIPYFEGVPDLAVADIASLEVSGNDLWVATWTEGIYHFDVSSQQPKLIRKIEVERPLYVYDIVALSSEKGLLVGTSEGLKYLSYASNQLVQINDELDDEVLSVCLTEKEIWVGTRSSGLYKLSKNDYQVMEHFKPGSGLYNVSNRTISTITEDKAGNVWLGTHYNGINVFKPSGEALSIIGVDNPSDKFSALSIWGVDNLDANNLLIGSDGGGLYQYDLVKKEPQLIASTTEQKRITDDAVLAVLNDSKSRIWIGTYSGGLNLIENNRAISIGTEVFLSQDIRVIEEDSKGTIWIGTNRGGLYSVRDDKKPVLHQKTSNLDIRSIILLTDYKDIIWLVTYGDGLVAYDLNSTELRYFDWNGETDFTPIGLDAAAYDGRIWIGTKQNGLVVFDPKEEDFERIDETRGLLNNTVRAVVPFGQHIWMSSNIGISAYQINTGSVFNYNTSDDFLIGQFNDGSGLILNEDYVAFGNLKGLIFFEPNELLEQKTPPPIVLSSLSVDEQLILNASSSGYLDRNIAIAKELTLGPNNNNFSLQFGTFSFPSSDNWRYQFMLQNHDDDWINANSIQEATYRNVPSGTYIFRARIVDFRNRQVGQSRDLIITINPPWYRTIYAYSAAVFLVIIILYLVYSYNYERANFKQSLVFEKKLRQQQEEVMQDKIRFYTNFSHEMRTPITLISGPTNDLLRSEHISVEDKQSLRLIKRNSNALLKLINRLLEFRKIETENTTLSIAEYDLTILAQEEAESFAYASNERGVKFGFYSESNLKAWIDIEKVQIIINNLLSNALKYSNEGDKIDFGVFHKEGHFIIEVKDEGRGISKSEQEKIFTPFYQAENSLETGGTGIGLALCKNLAELHNGKIDVESKLGKGSVFRVMLKEGKAHFDSLPNVRFITPMQGDLLESKNEASVQDITVEELENEKVMLVADDNRDIREYISLHFNEKFKVVESINGADALVKAKEMIPDIIISDIMMPEMDGIAFCKEIKNNLSTSHIPILLLTAKGGNQSKQEGYEVGADAYLTKPFDSGVLKARVSNLLSGREKLRELHENGHWLENKDVPSKEVEFILKVEASVLELVTKGNLNVVELCRELGFSRTSLYRKIKSLTGQSIKQFIRSIKLKKAAEILITDDISVSEVAFAMDFTDLKYFRTCFKTQHGMLPSEYRNKHKSEEVIDQSEIKKTLKI